MKVLAPPSVSQHAQSSSSKEGGLVRALTPLDALLLVVSGVIGSSVFLTAKDIAAALPSPIFFLGVWMLGGLVSLLGCFAFSELATMFPQAGGQYVYLRESFGTLPAFLYGWMTFTVTNGGTIAALAMACAVYTGELFPWIAPDRTVFSIASHHVTRANFLAVAAISLVTWINIMGVRRGAWLQNVATWLKFGAMLLFVLLAATVGKGDWHHLRPTALWSFGGGGVSTTWFSSLSAVGVALIAVFWAYDGWVYVTWVAGEIENPSRTLPLAMVGGIVAVTFIYVTMNVIYLYALPLTEIVKDQTIAKAAAAVLFSPHTARFFSAIIAVSSFGAMATCVLAGGRVYYAMAKDQLFFARMAQLHPKWRTPALSLVGQAAWATVLALSGRYDQLYTYVMFMMVLSYTLTVIGLFILRWRRPLADRPYRCFGYPWLPAFYVLIGVMWTSNTIITRPVQAMSGITIVLLGVPAYFYWRSKRVGATCAS